MSEIIPDDRLKDATGGYNPDDPGLYLIRCAECDHIAYTANSEDEVKKLLC